MRKIYNEIIHTIKDYILFVSESNKYDSMNMVSSVICIPEFIRFERLRKLHREYDERHNG